MATKAAEPGRLSTDRPIQSEEEDQLGFAPFADAVARSICDMVPPEGLVISLEAPWGSGKSSAIELICRALVRRALGQPTGPGYGGFQPWDVVQDQWSSGRQFHSVEVVRFNPWMFSGQETLIKEMFNSVGPAIGYDNKQLARAVAKIRDAIPSMAKIAGAAGVGLATHGTGIAAGSALGSTAGDAVKKLFPQDHSLEQVKGALADELAKAKKRVVIVIDDVDRLLPLELRQLLSAVKSLGDLPNVVYLLAFDRAAVVEALGNCSEPVGEPFLEKIIQVGLQLPPPTSSDLYRLFFARLNEIIGDDEPADTERWAAVFRVAGKLLKTPRDIARFSNVLRVAWPSVRGEVDITDLVALTMLQLFDSKAYSAIVKNIEAIAGPGEPFLDKTKLAARLDVDGKIQSLSKEIISHLFPRLAEGWKISVYDRGDYLAHRQQRRVATEEYYRNYFIFSGNPNRITKTELEAALASPEATIPPLVARLVADNGQVRVPEFLAQLMEEVSQRPVLSVGLARAILDVSDALVERMDVVRRLFAEDNIQRLRRIMLFGLRALPQVERNDIVKIVAVHPRGLMVAMDTVNLLASEHGLLGKPSDAGSEPTVSLEVAQEAVDTMRARFNKLADAGRLLECAGGVRLLWSWSFLTSPPVVKAWLDSRLGDRNSLMRLAYILPGTGYSSAIKGDGSFLHFDKNVYADIIDVDALDAALRGLQETVADPDERRTLERFFSARRER